MQNPRRAVDAGRGVLLQGHGALPVAVLHGLLGGTKLGGDAPLLIAIPARPHDDEAGPGSDQKKDLRHDSEPEARPKRARFDR